MNVCVCVFVYLYVHVLMCVRERVKEEIRLQFPLCPLDGKCVMSRDQNYNNNTYIL